MQIREYTEADFGRIRELHARSGFRYALPNFSSEEFCSARIAADKETIGMAAFLRRTAEAFLICDPNWRNAAWRELALRNLQNACREDAAREGIAEVNAFLPPEVAKRFGARLLKAGWKRYQGEEWRCFSFEV